MFLDKSENRLFKKSVEDWCFGELLNRSSENNTFQKKYWVFFSQKKYIAMGLWPELQVEG